MKPYIARLFRSGYYGYMLERVAIIVQVSRSTALGEALMEYPDSSAEEWTIEELDLSTNSITEIMNCETN